MEITLLNETGLRIKGKQASLYINPSAKTSGADGIIMLNGLLPDKSKIDQDQPVIKGPGEYELGGMKITGFKSGNETVYSLNVDRIEILLANGQNLEKDYAKIKEHNIVILYIDSTFDLSFITSLATNSLILFGEKAEESIVALAKDGYRKESKYSVTYDKLPQEMEEILLQ